MLYIFLKQFLFLSLFISFGYVIGRAFLKNFSFFSITETCAFSISIGWGVIAFLMTFLGFLGWLRPFIFFPVLIAVFAISLLLIIQNRYFEFKYLFLFYKHDFLIYPFKKALLLSCFILLLFLTAYPVIEWDAISYHLPLSMEFISQGRIVAVPFLRFPVFPGLIDLFFALALMSGDTLFANLIQYAMAIVIVLLIYSFAQRYFNKEIGFFSAFVFLSSPIVLGLSVVPLVEIGATLFCFSAFYALCIWLIEKKRAYAVLSAIFWGLAFGSKYYAILFFLATFLTIIVLFNKEIKFNHAVFIVLLSVLVAFPWYFRNKTYSGDWFFPLCSIDGVWRQIEVNKHLAVLRSLGLGKSIKLFFMLPINLLRYNDKFHGSIGPFIIISAVSFFFVKKWSRLVATCVIIVLLCSLFWFYNFQALRYLVFIFPILALLAGWTLQRTKGYLNLKKQWFWNILITIVLLFGCHNSIKIIRNNGPLPVTNTERFEYIAKRKSTYKAINFLNNIEQGDTVVYALFDEGSVFYHKNKVIGDHFGPGAYKNVLPYISKPLLLQGILKNYGAKYFLVNKNIEQENLHILEDGPFKLIYSDQNAFIFEIL